MKEIPLGTVAPSPTTWSTPPSSVRPAGSTVVRSARGVSPQSRRPESGGLRHHREALWGRSASPWTTPPSSPRRSGSSSPRAASGDWSNTNEINWWDFIGGRAPIARLPNVFRHRDHPLAGGRQGAPASTKTIGSSSCRLSSTSSCPGVAADRVLNGPTNDVWIDPWLNICGVEGLVYHFDSEVRAIHCDRRPRARA